MTRRTLQKLLGLAILAVTVLDIVALHDLTLAFFTVPLGLYALFTKSDILVPVNRSEKRTAE